MKKDGKKSKGLKGQFGSGRHKGAGMVGMGGAYLHSRAGSGVRSHMPDHAVKASRKRVLASVIKQGIATRGFQARMAAARKAREGEDG